MLEPWKLKVSDKEKMNNILHLSLEQIAKISILLNPIIPIATTKVLNALNVSSKSKNLSFVDNDSIIDDDLTLGDLKILFKKIN